MQLNHVSIQANASHFWKYVNPRRKIVVVPSKMNLNGKHFTSGQNVAYNFVEYFESVYTDAN